VAGFKSCPPPLVFLYGFSPRFVLPRLQKDRPGFYVLPFSEIVRNTKFYSLVLRQSAIKQQSMFPHWPFDLPKHGVQPSVVWIEWMSSAFFIFPGLMPRASALFLISVIVIRFCFTFVAGIIFFLSVLSSVELCPTPFSLLRNQRPT